ncbi:MAG: hypothetical protein CME62_13705 [Halobacteriovoraceae bacterium]|nr:hypothetical protein [Halobacteriovoraceae bacterium]|tara:strand:- start:5097 stop:5501 length:405 start_codon:yes stop_codon:yes gene_type:complete
MNNQVITNALKENFNINNIPGFTSESINLALINRNSELKLESELADIEKELQDISVILKFRGEASGVYAMLLASLEKAVLDIHDLFDTMAGTDELETSLILEKIKVKINRLLEKLDALTTFVYAMDEVCLPQQI